MRIFHTSSIFCTHQKVLYDHFLMLCIYSLSGKSVIMKQIQYFWHCYHKFLKHVIKKETNRLRQQQKEKGKNTTDRIPSTTPGAEPPRDARDSGSARSHSTHLETSSSDRPKWPPTRSSTRYQDEISVKCTRRTLRMPSVTRAAHAQPSLSNFPRRDSNFGERTRSRGTTLGERNFPTSPQNKKTKLTHCSIYVPIRTISTSHAK